MPLESSRTLLPTLMVVLDRNPSAFARSNRGCTPATYSSNCETRIHRGSTATSAMKLTSLMSSSRCRQGSRPKTLSVPSYGVRPTIALRAVVLPAPFGPIRPRMRPSSTRRSTPSSAMVVPKALRRPRASMHAMASAFLLAGLGNFRFVGARFRGVGLLQVGAVEQFLCFQSEPLDCCGDPWPLFIQEFLPLAFEQQLARAGVDEHAQASPAFHQPLVHQLLVTLQDRERIHAVFSRHVTYRRQRIAFLQDPVENHCDDTVPQLAVNRLAVIPLTVHPGSYLVPSSPC